jgi:hypothetical protein
MHGITLEIHEKLFMRLMGFNTFSFELLCSVSPFSPSLVTFAHLQAKSAFCLACPDSSQLWDSGKQVHLGSFMSEEQVRCGCVYSSAHILNQRSGGKLLPGNGSSSLTHAHRPGWPSI